MKKKLLNINDINYEDFENILSYSSELSKNKSDILKNKNIGLIFEKNSTRTRLSFKVGINQLGGNYIDINLNELNLQRIESFEDTFEIMACYLDALVYRTTDHKKLNLASNFFNKPIINALSDISHPCQAISDIYTIREHFNRNDDFKIIWCGDLNNVLFSFLEISNFLPNTTVDIFTDKKIYEDNFDHFPKSEKISYHFSLDDKIIKKADCVMTDVHNSMNDMENKEVILNKFQVNRTLMNLTSENTIFMHCLPAKIDSEVTNDVIKGEKSVVVKQAYNRMVAQKGILKWLGL